MDAIYQANVLAKQGKFEQALARHIWFHNHALNPAYYGVRLSYALKYWVQLGEKYRPALQALRNIRDEKTRRLLEGEEDERLFHDVTAINAYLEETKATVHAFKQIEAERPDFAAKLYTAVERTLFFAGEFELIRKYMGDPMARFLAEKRDFVSDKWFILFTLNIARSRQALKSNFASRTARLITVVHKTDDPLLAREIQSRALSVLDDALIRDAIVD